MKRLLSLVAATAMILSLAACGRRLFSPSIQFCRFLGCHTAGSFRRILHTKHRLHHSL